LPPKPSPAPLSPSTAAEMSRSNVHISPETLDLACGADRIVNHDLAEQ